jgi:hypothetical protein
MGFFGPTLCTNLTAMGFYEFSGYGKTDACTSRIP